MEKAKKFLSVLLAVCLIASLAVTGFAASYADTVGHWAEKAIDRWTEAGVLKGYNAKAYGPDDDLTRGQAAIILARLVGLTAKADISKFTDVAPDAYYADAIAQVYARGIMNGYNVTTMAPDAPVTREMFFTMLVRALGLPSAETASKTYTDAARISPFAVGPINTLTNAGYLKGNPDGSVAPLDRINRAQVASVLAQTIVTYVTENNAEVVAPEAGVVLVVADNVTVKSEKNEPVTVVVAKDDANVDVETEGTVTVVAENTSVKTNADNTVVISAKKAAVAAGKTARIVVNAAEAQVSLDGTTAPVEVVAAADDVAVTDAPANTTVTAEENVTGATVNGEAVEGTTTPSEPTPGTDTPVNPQPQQPAHTHSFDAADWHKINANGVDVYVFGSACTCGEINYVDKEIVLDADLELDAPIMVASGQNITIDLAGHNIVAEGHDAIYNYGDLTLKSDGFAYPKLLDQNGNIVFDTANTTGTVIVKGGEALNGVVNNGTFKADSLAIAVADDFGSAIVNRDGTTEVENAVLIATGLGNCVYVIDGVANLNDGTVALSATYGFAALTLGGTVNVNGGSYYSVVGFPFCVAKNGDKAGNLNLNAKVVTERVSDTDVEADGGAGEVYWLAGTIQAVEENDISVIVALDTAVQEANSQTQSYAEYFMNLGK